MKWVDPYGSWSNYVVKSLCITDRQRSFIKAICKELKIEFDGNTKEAARQFISKHIDEYYKKKPTDESWKIKTKGVSPSRLKAGKEKI